VVVEDKVDNLFAPISTMITSSVWLV